LVLKNLRLCNIINKANLEKKIIYFVGILKVTDEKSRIRAGLVSQRDGSEDSDPYQNVTDPEHSSKELKTYKKTWIQRIRTYPDPKGYGIKCADKKLPGHGRPWRNKESAH
jgi:hypothetical protein